MRIRGSGRSNEPTEQPLEVGESLRQVLARRLGQEISASEYTLTVDRVRSMLRERSAALAAERQEAPLVLDDLLAQAPGRRLLLVRNSARYQSLALGYLLVDRCVEALYTEAEDSVELAALAAEVASQLDCDRYTRGMVEDLKALAWAHLADAHRRCGDMAAALQAMGTAETRFRWGTGDGTLEARILGIKVSLCRRLGKFQEGLALMDRVIILCRREGSPQMVGRALIKKARMLKDLGDPRTALWLLRQASRMVDGDADPRVKLFLRHHLICCLIDLGEVPKARRLLRLSRSTYLRFQEGYVRWSLRWVEGLVAAGLGRFEEALALLRETREGLEELGQSHRAAQVAMDLAGVYEDVGQHAEALALAEEALQVFRDHSQPLEAANAELLIGRMTELPAAGSLS
jgi:tetratricopeptide (TPR) repeat protein